MKDTNNKTDLIERRRREILTAAKRIFAENGFRRTKIDQIANTLNVGKGTIYRYFDDKKSLFLAVFEQGTSELRERFRTDVEPVSDPKEKIAAAVKTYLDFFDNNRDLIEILMQVRSEFKDDYRRNFLAIYADYIVKIQENLRIGIKKGIFRDLDVERTAEAISATLYGVLQSFYIREFGSPLKKTDHEVELSAGLKNQGGNRAEQFSEQRRESLTDRIEAVKALLLQGLLKR